MTNRQWYAVAFDVAGGIAAWSGPWTWSCARIAAKRLERRETVSSTQVQRKGPSLKPWTYADV